MKPIKRKFYICFLISLASLFILAGFACIQKIERIIFYGGAGIILIFIYHQSRILYSASLIYNNRILSVPRSKLNMESHEKDMEETIVSTFGLLLRNKVYKWGCDGVDGVRLNMVQMDRDNIRLMFGAKKEKTRIELFHGISDGNEIVELSQKIWRETGVEVELNDF